jgi:hypothetical protein
MTAARPVRDPNAHAIALQNKDSSLVSFSDKDEVTRVRTHFLKKKLGLTEPDADLDKTIMAVADTMRGDRTKNRWGKREYWRLEWQRSGLACPALKISGEPRGHARTEGHRPTLDVLAGDPTAWLGI